MSSVMEDINKYILISYSEDEGERRDFDLNEDPHASLINGLPFNSQVLISLHVSNLLFML